MRAPLGVVLDPFVYGGAVHVVLPPCVPTPIEWPSQSCDCSRVTYSTGSAVQLSERASSTNRVQEVQ